MAEATAHAPVPRARLLLAALPPLATAGCAWWLLSTGSWAAWGVVPMEPKLGGATSFGDLSNITATAACLAAGRDLAGCDPYGRPFQPYVVLPARLLSMLGLGLQDTAALGAGLAALYVLAVALLSSVLAARWPRGLASLTPASLALAAAAVSPPAMLMIERGQIEAFVLLLTVVALVGLSAASRRGRACGAAAAVGAIAIKYFPLGLFLPFLCRGRPPRPALAALLLSSAWLLLSGPDVLRAAAAAHANEPATTKSAFGSPVLLATWLSSEPLPYAPDPPLHERWNAYRGYGIALLAALAALGLAPARRRSASLPPLPRNLLLGGSGVLLAPFLIGVSHDYRLVFLLPVVVGAMLWWSQPSGPALLPAVMTGAALLALWTGAAMATTSWGFAWPRAMLLAGDIGLTTVLGLSLAVWTGPVSPR